MTGRRNLSRAFIDRAGWETAHRCPLAGDASNRKYDRLTWTETGETAVLMDADPALGEDVRPFVVVARYLQATGLSPPRILAEALDDGFLLLEDLGDALFVRLMAQNPDFQMPLYTAATDALVQLHRHPALPLALYSPPVMTDLAALAYDKYRVAVAGSADGRDGFVTAFEPLLALTQDTKPVLIQRDYHSENLIWLSEREGPARVGLLDFQDAMIGHPAYDLVSLLQDARRDVPKEIETKMISHFMNLAGYAAESFVRDYALLGVQRSLRILGVFARLATDYGKLGYIDLIPRVWNYLLRNLRHPIAVELSGSILSDLPTPTPDVLDRIRAACRPISPTP
ncbi:MAG: phosphotransferase [Rhodobacteraceae bacterium]|nr:phosphotransferase [Paracoccaceae bacterium]